MFLLADECLRALGHLYPSHLEKSPSSNSVTNLDLNIDIQIDPSSLNGRTINVLKLMIEAQRSSQEEPSFALSPWKTESSFLSYWHDLESIQLQNPHEVAIHTSYVPDELLFGECGMTKFMHTVAWHSAVIILHRCLFNHAGNGLRYWIESNARSQALNNSSGPFWKEHINICTNSLVTIARLGIQLLRSEEFFLV